MIESSAFSCFTCVSLRRDAENLWEKKLATAFVSGEIKCFFNFKRFRESREEVQRQNLKFDTFYGDST